MCLYVSMYDLSSYQMYLIFHLCVCMHRRRKKFTPYMNRHIYLFGLENHQNSMKNITIFTLSRIAITRNVSYYPESKTKWEVFGCWEQKVWEKIEVKNTHTHTDWPVHPLTHRGFTGTWCIRIRHYLRANKLVKNQHALIVPKEDSKFFWSKV